MDRTLLNLIRACKEEPFDDLRRLVLADWLEENGDPERAELIRLQIRLAHEGAFDSPEEPALRLRCQELIYSNSERWLGATARRYGSAGLTGLEALFLHRTLPQARGVAALARSELASRLVRLELDSNRLTDGGVVALARMEARRLVGVTLAYNRIGPAGVGTLAASASFPALAALDLSGNRIGDEGVHTLTASFRLTALRGLSLNENRLTTAGIKVLRGWRHRRKLTRLSVDEEGIREVDLSAPPVD